MSKSHHEESEDELDLSYAAPRTLCVLGISFTQFVVLGLLVLLPGLQKSGAK